VSSTGYPTQDRSGEFPGEEALKKRGELFGARREFFSSIANLIELHIYNRIDQPTRHYSAMLPTLPDSGHGTRLAASFYDPTAAYDFRVAPNRSSHFPPWRLFQELSQRNPIEVFGGRNDRELHQESALRTNDSISCRSSGSFKVSNIVLRLTSGGPKSSSPLFRRRPPIRLEM
jgi:hypothetical protein